MLERFGLRLLVAAIGPVFLCAALSGCGGTPGNHLTGNVTFDGKPVPAGKVYISPDSSKGNTGHTGYADIKDGKYDTAAPGSMGAPSGAVVLSVEGYDPNAPTVKEGGEDAVMKSLFARYEIKADLPDGEATQDIDVPKEQANVKAAPERFIPGP